ncbi:MAG: SOS response-associated peptidase [Cyanobacteria bacterium P01_A01_bin.135]
MCGRFTLRASGEAIAAAFDLNEVPDVEPRYNIAPSQSVLAVTTSDRQTRYLRWGLVPHWAKDIKIGYRLINARAETAAEKPSFRQAFRRRRCLVLADGFYEWQRPTTDRKQPFYFYQPHQPPFGFAGLWETWQDPDNQPLQSCTLLTGPANDDVASVHHRMPIILAPEAYDLWLDAETPVPALQKFLSEYQAQPLLAHPVSTAVNSPRQDSPELTAPLASL